MGSVFWNIKATGVVENGVYIEISTRHEVIFQREYVGRITTTRLRFAVVGQSRDVFSREGTWSASRGDIIYIFTDLAQPRLLVPLWKTTKPESIPPGRTDVHNKSLGQAAAVKICCDKCLESYNMPRPNIHTFDSWPEPQPGPGRMPWSFLSATILLYIEGPTSRILP